MTRHRGGWIAPTVNAGFGVPDHDLMLPLLWKEALRVRLPPLLHRPIIHQRVRASALLAALLVPLAACSSLPTPSLDFLSHPPQVRGNRVDADRLAELVPGVSTRADVTAVLGSPSARATFDDTTWIYISAVTRPRIGSTQAVLEQQVVTVSFDSKGTMQGVATRTGADSRPVDLVSRTTPAPGTDAGFFQQLFGNIGRFGPGGGAGAGSGTSSSSY